MLKYRLRYLLRAPERPSSLQDHCAQTRHLRRLRLHCRPDCAQIRFAYLVEFWRQVGLLLARDEHSLHYTVLLSPSRNGWLQL
jgi:hypothetical protein